MPGHLPARSVENVLAHFPSALPVATGCDETVLWRLLTSTQHERSCPRSSRLPINRSFGYVEWISPDKDGSLPSARELCPAQALHIPPLVIIRLVFALDGVLNPSRRPRMQFLFECKPAVPGLTGFGENVAGDVG